MTNESPSEHDLPDDVERWPNDPETLLGVPEGASRRDLKRTYTRLIKRYKPEHAPEQFRRLREAFEYLDRELEWKEEFLLRRGQQESKPEQDPDEDADPETISSVPADVSPTIRIRSTDIESGQVADDTSGAVADDQEERTPDRQRSETVVREKSPDQWWQIALDGGDLKVVYAGLVVHVRRRQASELEFARLYWLLTLTSDLEPERDPCSWLVEGLRRYGEQRTRLYEMLDIEVRRRGGQIPLVLADELFEGNHPVHRLVDLAATRWHAARRQIRFDVIGDDFQRLKRRFIDEPDQWLRLLNTTLQSVLLTHADAVLLPLREELEQLPFTSSQNWIWDSIEFDLQLHDAWRQGPAAAIRLGTDFPERVDGFLRLLESTWQSSPAEARAAVIEFCQRLTENPDRRLNELSHIEKTNRPLLRRLLQLIEEQQDESEVERVTEMTPGLDQELQRFVHDSFHFSEHANFDVVMLNFCLREAVTPRDVADTLNRMNVAVPDSYFEVAERSARNLSLNCIVQAHRLLW